MSTHEYVEIEEFYERMTETMTKYKNSYILVIGDFNARLGKEFNRLKTKQGILDMERNLT